MAKDNEYIEDRDREEDRDQEDGTVTVRVTWMAADHPFQEEMAVTDSLALVQEKAMIKFGLRDEVVDGNQVRYYLYKGGTKLTDLSATIKSELKGHQSAVVFRLVRDLIAG